MLRLRTDASRAAIKPPREGEKLVPPPRRAAPRCTNIRLTRKATRPADRGNTISLFDPTGKPTDPVTCKGNTLCNQELMNIALRR